MIINYKSCFDWFTSQISSVEFLVSWWFPPFFTFAESPNLSPGLTFGECFSQPLDMVKLPEKLQHLTLRYAEPLDARARDGPRMP